MKTVLVFAPHIDDMELGCGGTIARLVRDEEYGVIPFSFSFGSATLEESKRAMDVLGIYEVHRYHYPVRRLEEYRQEILDMLFDINVDLKPDIVFCPSSFDIHQDHQTICREVTRAFKQSTILGYEMPWNNLSFRPQCFFKLTQGDIDDKINAILQYDSQAHKRYTDESFIRGVARTRGVQAGSEFAEAFEVIRWIV